MRSARGGSHYTDGFACDNRKELISEKVGTVIFSPTALGLSIGFKINKSALQDK